MRRVSMHSADLGPLSLGKPKVVQGDMVVEQWGNAAALLLEDATIQHIPFSGHKLGDLH